MAHLTRPAVISEVSAGSFPKTAAENRAKCDRSHWKKIELCTLGCETVI